MNARQALERALQNWGDSEQARTFALISIAQSLIDIREELDSIEQNTRPE